jgi:hypothetical protein
MLYEAGLQRATFVVGVRSGRRVGIDSDEPAPTVWVPPGVPASTAKTGPAPRLRVLKTRRRVPCVAARTRMLTSPRQGLTGRWSGHEILPPLAMWIGPMLGLADGLLAARTPAWTWAPDVGNPSVRPSRLRAGQPELSRLTGVRALRDVLLLASAARPGRSEPDSRAPPRSCRWPFRAQ